SRNRFHSPMVRRTDSVRSEHVCASGFRRSEFVEEQWRIRRTDLGWRSNCHDQNAEGGLSRVAFRSTERGFSLIELLVAVCLMLIVTSVVFGALNPAHGWFRAEPEIADLQQRLRVATDAVSHDLLVAGRGVDQGTNPGPLTDFFAPVLPFRQGRRNADSAGTF